MKHFIEPLDDIYRHIIEVYGDRHQDILELIDELQNKLEDLKHSDNEEA